MITGEKETQSSSFRNLWYFIKSMACRFPHFNLSKTEIYLRISHLSQFAMSPLWRTLKDFIDPIVIQQNGLVKDHYIYQIQYCSFISIIMNNQNIGPIQDSNQHFRIQEIIPMWNMCCLGDKIYKILSRNIFTFLNK